jgi:hypothetical protein
LAIDLPLCSVASMGSLDPLNGSGGADPGNEPIGPSPRPGGASRLAELTARLRDFGRRRRALIAVVGSLATAAVLAFRASRAA